MSTSGSRRPKLPEPLEPLIEEMRQAECMERALSSSDQRLQALLLKARIEREHRYQRHRKAGSYTLAEKYGLLDVFPDVVIVEETKLA